MPRIFLLLNLACLLLLATGCQSASKAPASPDSDAQIIPATSPVSDPLREGSAMTTRKFADERGPSRGYEGSPSLLIEQKMKTGDIAILKLHVHFEEEPLTQAVTFRITLPGFQRDVLLTSLYVETHYSFYAPDNGQMQVQVYNASAWGGTINTSRVQVTYELELVPPDLEEPNADNIIGTVADSAMATPIQNAPGEVRMHVASATALDIEEWYRVTKPAESVEATVYLELPYPYLLLAGWQYTAQVFHPVTLEKIGPPVVLEPAEERTNLTISGLPELPTIFVQVTGSPLPMQPGTNVAFGEVELAVSIPWEISNPVLGDKKFELGEVINVVSTYAGADSSPPEFNWDFHGGAECLSGCDGPTPRIQAVKRGAYQGIRFVNSPHQNVPSLGFGFTVDCPVDRTFPAGYPPLRQWQVHGPAAATMAMSDGVPYVFTVDESGLEARTPTTWHRPSRSNPGFWQSPTSLVYEGRIYVAFRNATTDTLDLLTSIVPNPSATNHWSHYILDNRTPTGRPMAMATLNDRLGIAYTVESPNPGAYFALSQSDRPRQPVDWTVQQVDSATNIHAVELVGHASRWWMAKQLQGTGAIYVGGLFSSPGTVPTNWQFHEALPTSLLGARESMTLLVLESRLALVYHLPESPCVRMHVATSASPVYATQWQYRPIYYYSPTGVGHVATVSDGSILVALHDETHQIRRSCTAYTGFLNDWATLKLTRSSYDQIDEPLLAMAGDDEGHLYTLSLRDPSATPGSPYLYVFDKLDVGR